MVCIIIKVVLKLNELSCLTKLGSAFGAKTSQHVTEVQGQASKQARQRQEERFQQAATSGTTSSQLMSQLSPSHLY